MYMSWFENVFGDSLLLIMWKKGWHSLSFGEAEADASKILSS